MFLGLIPLPAFDVNVGQQVVRLEVGIVCLQCFEQVLLCLVEVLLGRENLGQVVMSSFVLGVDLQDFEEMFLGLREIRPVNQGAFLVCSYPA